MRNYCYCLGLLICLATPLFAQQVGVQVGAEARLRELEEIVSRQQQRIEELQQKLGNQEKNTKEYTEKLVREYLKEEGEGILTATSDWGITAGYEDGFYVRSRDGAFELRNKGFVQYGIGIFENDTKDNNSFFANGVFLAFDMFFYDQWHARIEFDLVGDRFGDGAFQNANNFEPALRDAFVEFIGIPEFGVRVGQTHVPFTIEGQYNENEGISIFSEPFIVGWAHGRDPGAMVLGTFFDMLEYKVSIHNGEGQNNLNQTDEFLYAAQARFFYFGKSNNPLSFLHFGFIRSHDGRLKENGDFGSASMFTPWGRQIFGDPAIAFDDAAEGWRTAFDVGFTLNTGGLRVEGEYMYSQWERDIAGVNAAFKRLEGHGFYLGASYLLNLTGKDDGSGLIPIFKFSYTDLDDTQSGNNGTLGIAGQSVWVYTLGVGYAFNEYIIVNANWVMVNTDRSDVNSPKENNEPDGTEHGWFMQVTAQW